MARITLANGKVIDSETGLDAYSGKPETGDPYNIDDTPPPDPVVGDGAGGGGGIGTGGGPSGAGGPFAPSGFNLHVGLYETFNRIAQEHGVPPGYLAASIYYSRSGGFGSGRNEVSASEIAQMAGRLEGQAGQGSWAGALQSVLGAGRAALVEQLAPRGALDPRAVTSPSGGGTGRGPTAAEKALNAPVTRDDIADLYKTYLGRLPEDEGAIEGRLNRTYGQVLNEISSSAEARQFRIKGEKIADVRRWATTMWRQYGLPDPTLEEIMNIVNNPNATQQTVEAHLKERPYGDAKNPDGSQKKIGQALTIRDAVIKAFQKAGLSADEPTINDFIANNHPITNADAYVSQYIKQHGMVNPAEYADARRQLAQTLAGFGVNVNPNDVDPALLAAAVSGKWTVDQMTEAVRSRQAPGAPAGVTLDRYKTSKEAMDGIWRTYFPNVTMPKTYQDQMMTMTPDQMSAFVGAMPSMDAQQAGVIVPVKTYTDAKLAARQSLSKLGVIGREPSASEIAYFAAHGLDAEEVQQHYATDPAVLAQNPGAQYGLSRETYGLERSNLEQTYKQDFGGETPADGTSANEPDWLKSIFKQKISPQQAHSMFGDYFKRQGRAPTADEVTKYQTRHAETFRESGPASAVSGGTMPALAGPSARRR